jgi:hypothetical protein
MGIRDSLRQAKKTQVDGIAIPEINPDDYLFSDIEPGNEISCISIGGKLVGSLGNIVTITGKPKSRKTTFLQATLAAFLSGRIVFNISCNLPDGATIALIDTEQSQYDLYRGIQRIKKTANIEKIPKFLKIYQNRPLQASQNRQFLINLVQSDENLKIIFIDGMLDFVADMNNIEESSNLLFMLQKLCFEKNILIVTILHENKASNFTLGHIGSFLERKSQSLLRVEKNEYGSVLSSVYMRSDEDFAPVPIFFNYNTNQYELDGKFIKINVKSAASINTSDLKKIGENLFKEFTYITPDNLKIMLSDIFKDQSTYFIKELTRRLYVEDIINKDLNGKITLTTVDPF